MSETIRTRGTLQTVVAERNMSVVTSLGIDLPDTPLVRHWHRWSAIYAGPNARCVHLQFWRGPTTAGGVAEAHEWTVEQVNAGTLPDQHTDLTC